VFAQLVGAATPPEAITCLATAREALLAGDHSVIGVDDAHLLNQLSATQQGGLASPNWKQVVQYSGGPAPRRG
jgi:hypothetical protein